MERDDPSAPLTLDDLRRSYPPGVKLAQPERVKAEPLPVPREHRCLHCGAEFPSLPPKERHMELHHPRHEPEPKSIEPEPEPALTEALDNPEVVM